MSQTSAGKDPWPVTDTSRPSLALRERVFARSDGEHPRLPFQRYILEDAQPDQNELVTVAYSDGSQEDVDALVARQLAVELERANVAGIYAPRVIAATRRTVGELLASRPFDHPSADAAVLERLATGAEAVADAEVEASRSATIETQAELLSGQLNRWARWWHVKGDSPASHFNQAVNQAGEISDRGAASVEQLLRARNAAREHIADYCQRVNVSPPRGWEPE